MNCSPALQTFGFDFFFPFPSSGSFSICRLERSKRWAAGTQLTRILFSLVIASLTCLSPVRAQDSQKLPEDLTEIGLKKLLDFDLVVTSPGKKKQTLANVASATYVLTGEDIRRAGVTTIAEALRLVPGVDVSRVSSSQWAVSVRGFNQIYANKLLVLVDGVSVFSPFTNGIYWETLDLMLEDIDRVEVIRGPGAALWGANAVNGVINIITKHSSNTVGQLVTAGGGSHERAFGGVRTGAEVSDGTYARAAAKFTDRASNQLREGGENAEDDWQVGSAHLRIDSKIDEKSSFSTYGYASAVGDELRARAPSFDPPFVDPSFGGYAHWNGGYGAVRYRNEISTASDLDLIGSVYFQQLHSKLIDFDATVYEIDGTHRFSPWEGHDLVYGGSVRLFHSATDGTFAQDIDPQSRTMHRANLFLQDEFELGDPSVHLILGSKFEHNVSTGFEYMPNARLIWTPNDQSAVWGAISRAVAPPSLAFEDVIIPVATIPGSETQPPGLVTIFGSREVESEDLLAYEVGYRYRFNDDVSIELDAFYNDYDNILSQEPGMPFVGTASHTDRTALIIPLTFANEMSAESVGGEVTLEWKAASWWRLILGYSYIDLTAFAGNSLDQDEETLIEGATAKHKVIARTFFDLPYDFNFDVTGRYMDKLVFGSIPDYGEVDARLGWAPSKNFDVSVVGQNLLNSAHPEFIQNLLGSPTISLERGVFGKVTWRF